ncbi:MAG TPA: DUF924 family protein [Steroidobacteraceae bacterium]|nr:DUF924 family protein [Steroidobacteraceae bacterium]
MNPQIAAILDFWFAGTRERPQDLRDRMGFWFGAGIDRTEREQRDREIAERFGGLVEAAAKGEFDDWSQDPRGRLALILLLDQFPRNLHRGTADAFRYDEQALNLTLTGLEHGFADALTPTERAFFLMPLQHSERLADQERALREYDALVHEVPETLRTAFQNFADHARLHHDIVARFGRFPHRNAILGRPSTPAERDYLASDAPTFGQS